MPYPTNTTAQLLYAQHILSYATVNGLYRPTVHCLVNPQFDLSFAVKFFVKIDILITSAGVLNLSPTQLDVTLYTQNDCSFGFSRSSARDMTAHQTLSGVEQHPVRFASCFVFRDLATKRIRSRLVYPSRF